MLVTCQWAIAAASARIGNRSRIAAHQDVPDNLACVAAGMFGGDRRATYHKLKLEGSVVAPSARILKPMPITSW